MVLNNDTPAKYIGKWISQEKKHFSRVLQGDRRVGVLDNFVERLRIYQSLAVHDDWTDISWLESRHKKISENLGKKYVPNFDIQQFFVPNFDAQQIFVPNFDTANFCSWCEI